jgi:hypothetical protein
MREFVPFPLQTLNMFLCSLIGAANSINIRLRVSNPHGLLLWTGGRRDLPNTPDHLLLGIDRGYLQVQPQSSRAPTLGRGLQGPFQHLLKMEVTLGTA